MDKSAQDPAAAVLGSMAECEAVLRSSALRADDNDSEVVTTPAGRCSVAPVPVSSHATTTTSPQGSLSSACARRSPGAPPPGFPHVNLGLLQSEANLWRSPNPAEWHSTPGFFGGFATHNSSAAPGPVITEAQGQSPDIVRMF
ncbi:hypothetical protein C8Q74DRAFT_1372476 [Fomes fomentarius]|nr:hypothetical protein C8Q74DRAFT_1372476 [Fomes fomentarius]